MNADSVYVSSLFTIVVDSVVHGATVIPHDDVAFLPVVPVNVIGLGRVIVQVI